MEFIPPRTMRSRQPIATAVRLAIALLAIPAACAREPADRALDAGHRLAGLHVLPADVFRDGPSSGQLIVAANGRSPPFVDRQPVQGFSSILRDPAGGFLALSDNGFGRQENSSDYLLGIYRLSLHPATGAGKAGDGAGEARLEEFIPLRDPQRRIPWPIVADLETYPGSSIPVDPAIREGRLLTGGDFDPESFRLLPDGSFWIGDEFGPFLLHVDGEGVVLEAPVPQEGLASPQDPLGRPASHPRSGGFEGMSANRDLSRLYPMLEKPMAGEDSERGVLRIFEFDPAGSRYTGLSWAYRPEPGTEAIGEFSPVGATLHVVIERDEQEGPAASLKKLFLVDLTKVNPEGVLLKRELVDLLAIPDPDDVDGDGEVIFRMPFWTIEGVELLDGRSIAVVNDNNYPFSAGRRPGTPEDTEIARIKFTEPFEVSAVSAVDGNDRDP